MKIQRFIAHAVICYLLQFRPTPLCFPTQYFTIKIREHIGCENTSLIALDEEGKIFYRARESLGDLALSHADTLPTPITSITQ